MAAYFLFNKYPALYTLHKTLTDGVIFKVTPKQAYMIRVLQVTLDIAMIKWPKLYITSYIPEGTLTKVLGVWRSW